MDTDWIDNKLTIKGLTGKADCNVYFVSITYPALAVSYTATGTAANYQATKTNGRFRHISWQCVFTSAQYCTHVVCGGGNPSFSPCRQDDLPCNGTGTRWIYEVECVYSCSCPNGGSAPVDVSNTAACGNCTRWQYSCPHGGTRNTQFGNTQNGGICTRNNAERCPDGGTLIGDICQL